MRISDWSSDVCSSDLDQAPFRTVGPARHNIVARVVVRLFDGIAAETRLIFQHRSDRRHVDLDGEIVAAAVSFAAGDRKSVVSGKSVSVRVDLGGRRIINKKKTKNVIT